MVYSEEQYNSTFNTLPKNLQEYIRSEDTMNFLGNISDEYMLKSQNRRALTLEVMNVLYGLEPKSAFVSNITQSVGLDAATAQKIAAEIETELFAPAPMPAAAPTSVTMPAPTPIVTPSPKTAAVVTPVQTATPAPVMPTPAPMSAPEKPTSNPLLTPEVLDTLTPHMLAKIALEESAETLKTIGDYIRKYPDIHDGKIHPAYNYLSTSQAQGIF